jgi:uncharacterized protein YecE (DUF72 family)
MGEPNSAMASALSRIFVYFNNDQGGYALANSQTLRTLLAPGVAAEKKAA